MSDTKSHGAIHQGHDWDAASQVSRVRIVAHQDGAAKHRARCSLVHPFRVAVAYCEPAYSAYAGHEALQIYELVYDLLARSPEEAREYALGRFRANERHHPVAPPGIRIHQVDSRLIAGADDEVLGAQRRTLREVEQQLIGAFATHDRASFDGGSALAAICTAGRSSPPPL